MADTTKSIPRVDHIGSLLRPQEVIQKRFAFLSGQGSHEELKAAEDIAIAHVVRLQKDVRFPVITDGEIRRTTYTEGMFEKLGGLKQNPKTPLSTFKDYLPYKGALQAMGITEWPSVYCTGKLRRGQPVHAQDFEFLKQHVSPEDVGKIKVTLCAPTWIHLRHGSDGTYDNSVYANDDEYFADLTKAFREEIDELYKLESMVSGMKQAGVDPEELLSRYITVYNTITANRPSDLVVGVHTCRGNMKGFHFSEGSYDRIAEKLLRDLDVDVINLEYDTERAGSFGPLRFLPPNKKVVLGIVSTKSPVLETVDAIKERVHSAAEVISKGDPQRSQAEALDQICISPQCGFSPVFEGHPLSEEEQKAKLGRLVEAAEAIWA